MGVIIQTLHVAARQIWANKRWVFFFYGVNLLIAMVLMIPFQSAVRTFAGRSLMGKALAGRFDMDFLFELLFYQKNLLPTLMGMLVVGFAVYLLVTLFLSGGAYRLFVVQRPLSTAEFWEACGRYFWPFFRLALVALPVFAALMAGAHYLEVLLQRLLFGELPYEYISYWGARVRMLLRGVAFLLALMIFDYARVQLVLKEQSQIFEALLGALLFIRDHFKIAFGYLFVLSLIGWLALVIYNQIADLLFAPHWLVIFVLFLWQQLYMIFRQMLRLGLYAGEVHIARTMLLTGSGQNPDGELQTNSRKSRE
ncbi:MAG: hypothetical protein GXO78_02350 [Calditrichaeota bacterium]|nr:hypothetical protein [Calditrichota bacterium]